jgi:hypothetical protein
VYLRAFVPVLGNNALLVVQVAESVENLRESLSELLLRVGAQEGRRRRPKLGCIASVISSRSSQQ